jgi:hypothetical protein
MRFESRRGQNEENEKKSILQFEKTYFLYSSFFVSWSFGFAFERRFVELEGAPMTL